MLKRERQNYILEEIRIYNQVRSTTLSEKLQVSEDTIRRDLKELSDAGKILKVHGGAMSSNGYIPFSHQDREVHAHAEKVKIVKKGLSLIQDDQVILMDGGTTNLELVRLLPASLKATIFTNSIPVALQLTEHPTVQVNLLGGKVLKNAQVTIGLDVIESLEEIRAELCFIGTRSLDSKQGITDINREEAQVKRALMNAAATTVSMCISEKIGAIQPYMVAAPDRLDILITELDPRSPLLDQFGHLGLKII